MSFTDFDFPHTRFYESDLRELIAMYKKVLDDYNKLVDDIVALNEWRVQHEGEYATLLIRVANIEGEINTFEGEVEAKFADLERDLNIKFTNLTAEVRAELEATVAEINALFNELKNQLNAEIAAMKLEIKSIEYDLQVAIEDFREEMGEYLDERFEQFIQSLPDYEHLIVRNPVTGTNTTVQIALDDLYASFNVFGLTAKQFDELGLTCAEFDAKGLTAHEFDSMGYKLLGYPDPTYYMRDPFTGEFALVSDVVMKLFALHAGTITADEFDAKELTCTEFDALELTAFNFDFFGIPA